MALRRVTVPVIGSLRTLHVGCVTVATFLKGRRSLLHRFALSAALVDWLWYNVRCVCARIVQVPLMGCVDSVVAALEAHRTAAGVVETGLRFLMNIAVGSNTVG